MTETIHVYLADDHPIVRRGIRDLLETEAGIEVVGEASDGGEAVAGVAALQPQAGAIGIADQGRRRARSVSRRIA